jgi:hypothetical protein
MHSVGQDSPISLNWVPKKPEIIFEDKKYPKLMAEMFGPPRGIL